LIALELLITRVQEKQYYSLVALVL